MTQEVISKLNEVLKQKLTAINQSFLHARMLKHKGQFELADFEYKASIDAMKYADMLVEHILSREGAPNLQELGAMKIGKDAPEMLRNDMMLAEETLVRLEEALHAAQAQKDQATSSLLSRITENQREHIQVIRSHINPLVKECA